MLSCHTCGNAVQENEEYCPVDQTFQGYPNVKLAERESAELAHRLESVLEELTSRKQAEIIEELRTLAQRARAIINVDLEFAQWLLSSDRNLYATYRRQVEAGIRRPAAIELDQRRLEIESRLFGSRGDVTYAALGVERQGLVSYGIVALTLKELAIADRTTLLEENSYTFCRKHAGELPKGYRATWRARTSLVLIKIGTSIVMDESSSNSIEGLLLFSEGNRETDRFIEVHIWRGFTAKSLERIDVLAPANNEEQRLLLELVVAYAHRAGIVLTVHA